MNRLIINLLAAFILTSCLSNKQNKGFVTPESTDTFIDFTTNKTVIVLPVLINGEPKNYVFDTGADLSMVNRDKISGKTTKITGAGGKKEKLGSENINSFKIGNIEFKNTNAYNGNLSYIANQISNFGGIIGQSIISKSNWLVDYPKNKITISTKAIDSEGFETFSVKNIRDPHLDIMIDGEKYNALVDLGSSVALSIPENSALAKKLLAKYIFTENKREIFRIGGVESITEKIGLLQKVQIENTNFEAIPMNILPTSSIKIGNAFFKNYQLYIDNTNKVLKVKKRI